MKKGFRFTVALVIALLLALLSNTTYATSVGIYDDEYWTKDNEIRMLYGINLFFYDPVEDVQAMAYTETDEQLELYSSIKSNVAKFFHDVYGLEVEEKLSKMTVDYFYYYDPFELFAGYTVRNSSGIHLNVDLVTSPDFSPYLSSTFLHETMHYLGVSSAVLSPIDEGFAELLAIKCAEYCEIDYFPTYSYSFCLSVAQQLNVVNGEAIVKKYLTEPDFDISVHITEVLKDVPQLYNQVEDIGSVLSTLVGNLGVSYDDEAYVLAFIAQDVTNAYCKEFAPTKDEINAIRSCYFVKEIEVTKVNITDYGFELELY